MVCGGKMFTILDSCGLVRVPKNKYADDNIVYAYKNRHIDLSKPIQVYRNLHKKAYSVRQFGLVVAHAQRLCLSNCKFIVNSAGQARTRKERKKYVHAWIEGFYSTSGMGTTAARNDLRSEIRYNPYRDDTFICDNLVVQPLKLEGARFVILDEYKVTGSYLETL